MKEAAAVVASKESEFDELFSAELVLANAANGACPIIGEVIESGTGSDAVVGVADFGVVNITAHFTYVFVHDCQKRGLIIICFDFEI